MPSNVFFDQFPVEIIHILFNYIPVPELYFTFYNVSDYINAVLFSYPTLLINFQSYLPYHIDFICHQIEPDQILSLTLCDDINTNAQSELFLSYFHIEQCTRLRSLTLINIETHSLKLILPNLNKLIQLRSFSCNTDLNEADVKISTKLSSLTLFNIHQMPIKSFSSLRSLKIFNFSMLEFKNICSELSQLTSLDICSEISANYLDDLSSLSRLICLNMKLGGGGNVFYLIELFLPKLHRLKHFELQVDCNDDDMIDARRWERLTKSFLTFNFKFKTKYLFHNIKAFRTSFWLEEKHWLVVYLNDNLYTTPRFSPIKINTSDLVSITSKSSTAEIGYDHKTQLMLSTDDSRFPDIKILKLDNEISIENLFHTVDLHQIKHLILSSNIGVSMFISVIPLMPFLNELTIAGHTIPFLFQVLQDNIIEQIRILNLSFCYFGNESMTKLLCHCFPSIQYLNVSLISSNKDIVCFTQHYKNLLNASFGINSLLIKNKEYNLQEIQKIIENKYTCQIVYPSEQRTLSYVHIWLMEKVS
jgi:hypothetical protein